MSLTSWKAAFYPESAKAAAKRGELAAIEHSIRKWEGLTQENLAAHKVEQDYCEISGPKTSPDRVFCLSADTCALCQIHYLGTSCDRACSLIRVRGVPCYERMPGEPRSPYDAYVYNRSGDPQPMLRDLRSALALVQITKQGEPNAKG